MWNSDRCDSRFAVLWDTVVGEADSLSVEPPVMPRVRRLPRRLDDGSLQHEDQQMEDVYVQAALLLIAGCSNHLLVK